MTNFAQKAALSLAPHLDAVRKRGLHVAVSGGADSVALLLVLQELNVPILNALHCNFSLRGEESERDEAFVRRLCEERKVRCLVRTFDTRREAERTGESIEMTARRLRYAWFAEQEGFIAVAHHADDNLETLLLNLLRGSGLRGLTGMKTDNGRGILRPLLGVSRQEVLDYLEACGQTFVTDSSNADTQYRRNAIRHELLPLLRSIAPGADRALSRTLTHLQAAEEIYDYGLAALSQRLAPQYRDDLSIYPLREIIALGTAGKTWLFEQLKTEGFDADAIDNICSARNGALFFTPTHLATVCGERLEVAPRQLPPPPTLQMRTYPRPENFQPARSNREITLDADKVVGMPTLRRVEEGDRFSPFGMTQGSKLVSDYLTDRHRSRIEKFRALVLCDDRGILWLVGETIARHAAVTPATQRILHIRLEA